MRSSASLDRSSYSACRLSRNRRGMISAIAGATRHYRLCRLLLCSGAIAGWLMAHHRRMGAAKADIAAATTLAKYRLGGDSMMA